MFFDLDYKYLKFELCNFIFWEWGLSYDAIWNVELISYLTFDLSLMRIYITDSQFLKQVSRCKSMFSAEFASLENYDFKSWGTLREFGEEGGSVNNKHFPKDLFTSYWRSSTKWFPSQVVHRQRRFWLQKPNSPVVLHLRGLCIQLDRGSRPRNFSTYSLNQVK